MGARSCSQRSEPRAHPHAQGHRRVRHDIGPLEALAAFLEAGELGALVERILDEELGGEAAPFDAEGEVRIV
jgi:hypothetical protein